MINIEKYMSQDDIKKIKEEQNKKSLNEAFHDMIDTIYILTKYIDVGNTNDDKLYFNFKFNCGINSIIRSFRDSVLQYSKDKNFDMMYFYDKLFKLENYNICENIFINLVDIIMSTYSSYKDITIKINLFMFFIEKYNNDYIFENEKANNKFLDIVLFKLFGYLFSKCNGIMYGLNKDNKESNYEDIIKKLITENYNLIFKSIKDINKLTNNDRYFIKLVLNNSTKPLFFNTDLVKQCVFNYFYNFKINTFIEDKSINNFISKTLMTKFN